MHIPFKLLVSNVNMHPYTLGTVPPPQLHPGGVRGGGVVVLRLLRLPLSGETTVVDNKGCVKLSPSSTSFGCRYKQNHINWGGTHGACC